MGSTRGASAVALFGLAGRAERTVAARTPVTVRAGRVDDHRACWGVDGAATHGQQERDRADEELHGGNLGESTTTHSRCGTGSRPVPAKPCPAAVTPPVKSVSCLRALNPRRCPDGSAHGTAVLVVPTWMRALPKASSTAAFKCWEEPLPSVDQMQLPPRRHAGSSSPWSHEHKLRAWFRLCVA